MEQTFCIDQPDALDGAGRKLHDFFVHNGYESSNPPDSNEPLVFNRGETGAGWWTSDMSELATELVIEPSADTVRLHYEIDTSGQILTDEDRAFWEDEVKAAERYLLGTGELVDLRKKEALRAEKMKREHRKLTIWATAIVFFLVFIFGLVADRFTIF